MTTELVAPEVLAVVQAVLLELKGSWIVQRTGA
jgi:hypothetical protein